jgi:hypothetical protein
MASLPLGNDPDDFSEAFKKQREANRPSVKAAIDAAIKEAMRPRTPEQQARMEAFAKWIREERKPLTTEPHPTAEEMIREDRDR